MSQIHIVKPTARSAIEMWVKQYGFASRSLADGSNSGEISRRLTALKRPTKKQVEKIIGARGGWTTVFCDSCHEYVEKAATFGNDYSVKICAGCLRKALAKFSG
jgi:hypothetical protein